MTTTADAVVVVSRGGNRGGEVSALFDHDATSFSVDDQSFFAEASQAGGPHKPVLCPVVVSKHHRARIVFEHEA